MIAEQLTLPQEQRAAPRLVDIPLGLLPLDEDLAPGEPSAALVSSMRMLGLIEPIYVSVVGAPDRYNVVCGTRRVKAARKLGWTHIRALVGDLGAADGLVSLHENLAREDNPLQTIHWVWELARAGKSAKEIAHELPGLTASQVRVRLDLLKLPFQAQRALLEGRLLVSAAQQAAKEGPALHRLLEDLLDGLDDAGAVSGDRRSPAQSTDSGKSSRRGARRVGPADIAALKAALPRKQASFEEVFGFEVPSAAEAEAEAPDPVRVWERRAAGALRDVLLGAPAGHPARTLLVQALHAVAQEG